MKRHPLIRIRFPRDLVERIDGIAAKVSASTRKSVPRAAIVRALVAMSLRTPPLAVDVAVMVEEDDVRRGRAVGYSPKKKGASHG